MNSSATLAVSACTSVCNWELTCDLMRSGKTVPPEALSTPLRILLPSDYGLLPSSADPFQGCRATLPPPSHLHLSFFQVALKMLQRQADRHRGCTCTLFPSRDPPKHVSGEQLSQRPLQGCELCHAYLLQSPPVVNTWLPPQLCDNYLCGGGHGRSQRSAPLEENGNPQGVCVALVSRPLSGLCAHGKSSPPFGQCRSLVPSPRDAT